jgi:hypothetical protein
VFGLVDGVVVVGVVDVRSVVVAICLKLVVMMRMGNVRGWRSAGVAVFISSTSSPKLV